MDRARERDDVEKLMAHFGGRVTRWRLIADKVALILDTDIERPICRVTCTGKVRA
jgi:hypothetical protein